MAQLLPYARFLTEQDATLLTALLDKNAVSYKIVHERNQLDNIYLGEALDPLIVVQLDKTSFRAVNKLLTEQAREDFGNESFVHPLTGYETEELKEVIKSPIDWNAYDREIAKLLLIQRGSATEASFDVIDTAVTYKPERLSDHWVNFGYGLSFLSFIGIFIGLSITQARKTLSSGETVPIYDEASIKHGKRWVLIGAVVSAVLALRWFIRTSIFE